MHIFTICEKIFEEDAMQHLNSFCCKYKKSTLLCLCPYQGSQIILSLEPLKHHWFLSLCRSYSSTNQRKRQARGLVPFFNIL